MGPKIHQADDVETDRGWPARIELSLRCGNGPEILARHEVHSGGRADYVTQDGIVVMCGRLADGAIFEVTHEVRP